MKEEEEQMVKGEEEIGVDKGDVSRIIYGAINS